MTDTSKPGEFEAALDRFAMAQHASIHVHANTVVQAERREARDEVLRLYEEIVKDRDGWKNGLNALMDLIDEFSDEPDGMSVICEWVDQARHGCKNRRAAND